MNKVVVITGTSKGIGKAMALYYLNKNFVVAVEVNRKLGTIEVNTVRSIPVTKGILLNRLTPYGLSFSTRTFENASYS